MPTKIFTLMGGGCPFGKGCEIDSPSCRKCEWFYRIGTGTFFWCNHPAPEKAEQAEKPKKRGRPPGKMRRKPVNERKTKKR